VEGAPPDQRQALIQGIITRCVFDGFGRTERLRLQVVIKRRDSIEARTKTGCHSGSGNCQRRPLKKPAKIGWDARTRTWEWRNQNPLPYHLATSQFEGGGLAAFERGDKVG
jgi:hypothetical protein